MCMYEDTTFKHFNKVILRACITHSTFMDSCSIVTERNLKFLQLLFKLFKTSKMEKNFNESKKYQFFVMKMSEDKSAWFSIEISRFVKLLISFKVFSIFLRVNFLLSYPNKVFVWDNVNAAVRLTSARRKINTYQSTNASLTQSFSYLL